MIIGAIRQTVGEEAQTKMHACYYDKATGEFYECDYDNPDCMGCQYEKRIADSATWYCLWCGKEHQTRLARARQFCDWVCKDNWASTICNRWPGGMMAALEEFFSLYWGNPAFTYDELLEANKMMLGRSGVTGTPPAQ